jgi:hypothetical protein
MSNKTESHYESGWKFEVEETNGLFHKYRCCVYKTSGGGCWYKGFGTWEPEEAIADAKQKMREKGEKI